MKILTAYTNAYSKLIRRKLPKNIDVKTIEDKIFCISGRTMPPLRKAYFTILRRMFTVRLFSKFGIKHSAYTIAKNELIKTKKYGLTPLTIELYQLLLNYELIVSNDQRSAIQSEKELKQYIDVFNLEIQADIIYSRLVSSLNYHHSESEFPVAFDFFSNHQNNPKIKLSANLLRNTLLMGLIILMHEKKVLESIDLCLTALELLDQYFPDYHTYPIQFKTRLAECYILQNEYEKAIQIINDLKKFKLNPVSKYNIINLEISLLFKFEKFEQAYNLFIENFSHPSMRQIPVINQENWSLYEFYFDLLHKYINFPNYIYKSNAKLNQRFTTLRKEKKGYNVAVLICELLHNPEVMEYRIVAIKKYIQRHLKNENLRDKIFLQLLVETFTPSPKKSKIKKLYNELHEAPLDINPTVELIPYEVLLDIVMPDFFKEFRLKTA